ncbi:MAG TPA: hypothetical protein VLF40_05890 [Candidatus Saccharimonadales bacterium]|nr:hypothetical protein [Candidatus Saccharimonadales bacterium]
MEVRSKLFYWYAALVVAYVALMLLPTPDHATLVKYHLSASGLRLINFAGAIPNAVIWFSAFFAAYKLQRYGQMIKESKEGRHITKLSKGLFLLAIALPTTTILSLTLGLLARHYTGFSDTAVVITNYASLILPSVAFLWLNAGAYGLSVTAKTRLPLPVLNAVLLLSIILGVALCALINVGHAEVRNTYHLAPWVVMLTLAVPFMYIWTLGLLTVAQLREYSLHLKGIVYRKSWRLFIAGLASIILISIIIQYLTALNSWLTSLSLSWLLALLFLLLLLLTAAFIVVALGTQRLTAIEEA